MEIRRVNTLAFSILKRKEEKLGKKLASGGLFAKKEKEIKKSYLPVAAFRVSRPKKVRKGLSREAVYEKEGNLLFINLATAELYHVSRRRLDRYNLLSRGLNLSSAAAKTLGAVMKNGETPKDELDASAVSELLTSGFVRSYRHFLMQIITSIMDEVISEPDKDKTHIRHTELKERINVNFHIPGFHDRGYDLSEFLETTDALVEDYSKEPIKHSIDRVAQLLKDLFQSEASLEGVFFLPALSSSYREDKAKKEKLSGPRFPVRFKKEKGEIRTGAKIKPLSLSTEIGSSMAVPTQTETIDFSDVVDLEDVKKEIKEHIIYPITRPDLAKEYKRTAGGGILLYGPPGCGKSYLVKATIGECGASFYNINVSDLVKQGFEEGSKALHQIFEEAAKNPPAIIFFDEIDAVGGRRDAAKDQSSRMLINQLLTEMDGVEGGRGETLFIAATNTPWAIDPALRRSGRFDKQIFIPPPDARVRARLFGIHSKGEPLGADIDFERLAELTEGYSSSDIKNICASAAKFPWEEALEKETRRSLSMQDFLKSLETQKSSLLPWYKDSYRMIEESGETELYREYAEQIEKYAGGVEKAKKQKIRFSDVGGLEDVKEEIRKLLVYPLQKEDLAEEYGRSVRGGLLLYGPPGCGKTYIAKATAGECNASFFNVRITDVISPVPGESERRIREIFERASRNTPAVLFFDEIEAVFGRRDKAALSDVRLIDEFLTEMDGFEKTKGLIVIAATNAPWAIDPAMRRSGRFTEKIYVAPPDEETREAILKIHSRGLALASDVDLSEVARKSDGYTSSDLKAVCEEAAARPWEEALKGLPERDVQPEDFQFALKKTESSLKTWAPMARKQIDESGEADLYPELYKTVSLYSGAREMQVKAALAEDRCDSAIRKREELSEVEGERNDVLEKIKLAQHRYYKRQLAESSFKDIVEDYERDLIDLDFRISKIKSEIAKAEKKAA